MSLREETIHAFARVPHPGDDALTSCNCEECRWEVGRLRGKKWIRLSLDDFGAEDGDANFALLTPAAFLYFLPGLMLLAIDHEDTRSYFLGKVVGRITDLTGSAERRSKADQILKRLSGRQRQVLIDVIRLDDPSDADLPTSWKSAIDNLLQGRVTT